MSAASRVLSRLAALVLLVLLGATAWLAIAQPLAERIETLDDSIADARLLLERTRSIARARAETQIGLDRIRADPQIAAVVIKAPTMQLAAAELQDRVKRLVEAAGGALRSAQVLPAREEGGFRRVALRFTLDIDIEGLQRTFHAIESATPFLLLDNVELRGRQLRAFPALAGRLPDLAVSFDVVGFMRGTGS